MNGKYKINGNITIQTTDKLSNKSVFIDGHLWLEPKDSYDALHLQKRLKRLTDRNVPQQHLSIFELPEKLAVGKRSSFSFQIHFLTGSKERFKNYCERIKPFISHRIPRYLRVISDCGFIIHNQKKG